MVAVIAVFGPTASGKTAVAEEVADRLGTEVVSCDAMQVYRGLPILTNQPSRPTALVGIRDLDEEMSVGAYASLAHTAIDELVGANRDRGRQRGNRALPPRSARRPGRAAAARRRGARARAAPKWSRIRRRRTSGWPASIRAPRRRCTRTISGASCVRSSSRRPAHRSCRTTTVSGRAPPGTRR